mmetsp:Transcript_24225/g.47454  ORF Transcript_24225/g.47454 Transcript_24225/m.47454 type:complete len:83 (-) Transcript_24225:70-318(-)
MQNLMRYLHQWTPVATVGSFGRIPQEPEVTKLQKSKQHSADWMHANMYICELCVVAMGAWLRKRPRAKNAMCQMWGYSSYSG